MSYTAWSVVAFEQPTAAKWNQLGANDAGFKDGSNIDTNAILARHLSTSAIKLGYTARTSNFSTSSTTPVQVTDLSVTVTIPAGGRSIKITAFTTALENNTANQYASLGIWDGTVGSGTQLNVGLARGSLAGFLVPATIMAVVTPSAGSKTYNVGLSTAGGSGTAQLYASENNPAFILVEAI